MAEASGVFFQAEPLLRLKQHLLLEWINTYSFAAYIVSNEMKGKSEDVHCLHISLQRINVFLKLYSVKIY